MTVTRIVTSTPTILATVGTFEILTSKNTDSYENGRSEASKTRTAPTIPVTVHIFASAGGGDGRRGLSTGGTTPYIP